MTHGPESVELALKRVDLSKRFILTTIVFLFIAILFTFGPDFPAMAVNDALDDGKTHSRTLEFADVVQPLEHSEQLADILHVESRSVVTDA